MNIFCFQKECSGLYTQKGPPPEANEEASSSRPSLGFVPTCEDPGKRKRDDREVLSEDWTDEYLASAAWGTISTAVFKEGPWPSGIQVWQGKLLREGVIPNDTYPSLPVQNQIGRLICQ